MKIWDRVVSSHAELAGPHREISVRSDRDGPNSYTYHGWAGVDDVSVRRQDSHRCPFACESRVRNS